MLSQILRELRQSTEPVTSSDIARRLGIEPNTLEGILEQLTNQGKLRKVRQVSLMECRQEMKGKLSLYGDLCAFIGPAESVTYYEIVPEEQGKYDTEGGNRR